MDHIGVLLHFKILLVIEIQKSGNHCHRLDLVNFQYTVNPYWSITASLLFLMLDVCPSVRFLVHPYQVGFSLPQS